MTKKFKMFSTLCLFAFAIFVATFAITGVINKQSLFNVSAFAGADVDVSLAITNAGKPVELENKITTVSSNSNLDVAPQSFCGAGEENAVIYSITVNNSSNKTVRVMFAELDENEMENISVKHTYKLADGTIVSNNFLLEPSQSMTIDVCMFVVNANLDANANFTLNLSIERA